LRSSRAKYYCNNVGIGLRVNPIYSSGGEQTATSGGEQTATSGGEQTAILQQCGHYRWGGAIR